MTDEAIITEIRKLLEEEVLVEIRALGIQIDALFARMEATQQSFFHRSRRLFDLIEVIQAEMALMREERKALRNGRDEPGTPSLLIH
jgi:hypothetical protein